MLCVWYIYSPVARQSTERGDEESDRVNRWFIGWGIGGIVVAIAAALLVAIIALCRRIVGQADDITRALDGARENTADLFAVTRTNAAVDRITGGLRRARELGTR